MFLYILFLLNIFFIGYMSAMDNRGSGALKPLTTYEYKKRGYNSQPIVYKSSLDQNLMSSKSKTIKNSELETVVEPDHSATHDEPSIKKQKVVIIQPAPENSNVNITEINDQAKKLEQKIEKNERYAAEAQNKPERITYDWMFRSAASKKFAEQKKILWEQYGIELPGNMIKCKICEKVMGRGHFTQNHVGHHQEKWKCNDCGYNAASKANLKSHLPICRNKP